MKIILNTSSRAKTPQGFLCECRIQFWLVDVERDEIELWTNFLI